MKSPYGHTLFLIAGPSGVGKNALIERCLQRDEQLTFVCSATTRAPRTGESQRNPYLFVSFDDFRLLAQSGGLLEWQRVHGNYFYGTAVGEIDTALAHADAITDVEVLGAQAIARALPLQTCTIFVDAPSTAELERRIHARHPTDAEEVSRRLQRADWERKLGRSFDYSLCNDDLEDAARQLQAIITAHRAARATLALPNLLDHPPAVSLVTFRLAEPSLSLPSLRLGRYEGIAVALQRALLNLSLGSGMSTLLRAEDYSIVNLTFEEVRGISAGVEVIECRYDVELKANAMDVFEALERAATLAELGRRITLEHEIV